MQQDRLAAVRFQEVWLSTRSTKKKEVVRLLNYAHHAVMLTKLALMMLARIPESREEKDQSFCDQIAVQLKIWVPKVTFSVSSGD